jgi:23S rRNA (cytidine1920-2'-O)/16S rRNA (cytidine1409-2'-O)-methyltransferase
VVRRARLDAELVRRGLARSREQAAELVQAGRVRVAGSTATKPATAVEPGTPVLVEADSADPGYASRGGHKLAGALDALPVPVEGRRALDAGASTGGFTDVLLAQGAAKVHAVDVGHGQLAWKLRSDPRVVVHEKTNARYLTREIIADPIAALVCDASFIGLATLLPAPLALCAPGAWALALIKPQFEAGPAGVGRKGVVRDPAVHRAVCERATAWWTARPDWRVLGITESPITGPEGNREFLIAAEKIAAVNIAAEEI